MLVENGPEDIFATLCRALAQKSRWPQIGAKARELYKSHFTQDQFKARLFRALGLFSVDSCPDLTEVAE